MLNVIRNSDVFTVMEDWAPKQFAYDWDNVGLQLGSHSKIVNKIMVTLDVIESVVDEAIKNNIDLIIAHHPVFFKALDKLNVDTPKGRMIEKLIKNDITVYAAHTNLDVAVGGVNDLLAEQLDLQSTEVLIETAKDKLFKVAVFVPVDYKKALMRAFNQNGAGYIGNYSDCTFQVQGQGTFKPLEKANPFIGSKNKLIEIDEIKIETIVSESILSKVVNAMIQAHPYEEVAYDIYPLVNEAHTYGLGRIGQLNEQMSLKDLSEYVKLKYDIPSVRVVGDLTKKVSKVAILGGSGEKYFTAAKQMGAEVYITGDMTFHAAQDAEQIGLSIIDPGHHVEKIMKKGTQQYLLEKLTSNIEIIISKEDTEPFKFI